MAGQATVDQIQHLFAYPFRDPQWKRKLLIIFALNIGGFLIPILPWLLLSGYLAKTFRGWIRDADDLKLPQWEDWNELFLLGLRMTVIFIVAFAPLFILFLLGYSAFMVPMIAIEFSQEAATGEALGPLLAPIFGMFAGMMLFGVSILFALGLGIVLPPAMGHAISEDKLSAAFRVREWWPILRANFAGYLLSYIFVLGTFFLLTYLLQVLYMTIILCWTFPFISAATSVYIGLIAAALFGQAYRVGAEKAAG
jgi:hypothetical protein